MSRADVMERLGSDPIPRWWERVLGAIRPYYISSRLFRIRFGTRGYYGHVNVVGWFDPWAWGRTAMPWRNYVFAPAHEGDYWWRIMGFEVCVPRNGSPWSNLP